MPARRQRTYQPKPHPRPALPVGLYDLRAASAMFFAAAVLPEQFFTSSKSAVNARGTVALMRAVLEEAIHCLQQQSLKSGRRARRLTRETEAWFFTDDPCWVFSFVNICAVLDLDPAYIRWGLMQWRQHHSLTPQKPKRLIVPAHRPLRRAA
ncbi:MAG: hypothetical protein AB7P69_29045 [Candidatus Binatia bacterium]